MMMRNIDDYDDEVKRGVEEKIEEHMMKEEEELNNSNTSLLYKQHQMGSGGGADIGGNNTVTYATNSQHILWLAKSVDVYAASIPYVTGYRYFVTKIAAPTFGVTAAAAQQYVETRKPVVMIVSNVVEIGRVRMHLASSYSPKNNNQAGQNNHFAETSYALHYMESAAVCIAQNKPTLLLGETGC
eukprot:14269742-Ditylum_brightwellii.AAC.1